MKDFLTALGLLMIAFGLVKLALAVWKWRNRNG